MVYLMKRVFLILAITLSMLCLGQPGVDRGVTVEIATWQGGSPGAASLSFDDGYAETYNAVIPILAEKNISATFNVISVKVGGVYGELGLADWGQWRKAAEMGHEIGSHMATHVHVDEVSAAELAGELESSKTNIKKNIGRDALSFVYPGGAYDRGSRDVVANFFLSARTSDDGYNPAVPADMYLLKSKTVAEYNLPHMTGWADEASENGLWLIENLHLVGGENPTGYGFYMSTDDFTDHIDYLDSQGLWIAPQGVVARYVVERENSVANLSFPVFRQDSFSITLSNNLDSSVFNVHLTLVVTLPRGWNAVRVSSRGETLPGRVSKGILYIDAVPNNGRIIVTKHGFISYLAGLVGF